MQAFRSSLISSAVPRWITACTLHRKELCYTVKPEYVLPLFTFLKLHSNTQYKMLIDITAAGAYTRPLSSST